MAEMSRVKKFKDYRNSLQNSGEDVLKTQIKEDKAPEIKQEEYIIEDKRPSTESLSTLSVSYDKIMEAANEVDEKESLKKDVERSANKMRILKISLIVLACLIVAGAIIGIGILVFKK